MVEFRRGGRKVSQDEFLRGIERDVVDAATAEVEARARRARCPEHGRALIALRARKQGSPIIEACCAVGREAVEKAIR